MLTPPITTTITTTVPESFSNLSPEQLLSLLLADTHGSLSAAAAASASRPRLTALQHNAFSFLRSMWADSTWDNRRRLITRFTAFRRAHPLLLPADATDWAIVLFVLDTNTQSTTQLSYLKDLAALHRRIGFHLPICSMMSSALSARGGLIPEHQAVPATEEQVNRLLVHGLQYGPRLVAALFIMWKTASRFDDVARITSESLISCRSITATTSNNNSISQLILAWADRTKSTRRDPFRHSSWTVIHHQQCMEMVAQVIRSLAAEEPLLTWTSSQMVSFLREALPADGLTAHSMKRGAVTLLFMLISLGRPIPLELIPALAKHKTAADFPSVTLRYANNAEPVALALGTQRLTAHIPCHLPAPMVAGHSRHSPPPSPSRLLSPVPFDEDLPLFQQFIQRQQQQQQRQQSASSRASNNMSNTSPSNSSSPSEMNLDATSAIPSAATVLDDQGELLLPPHPRPVSNRPPLQRYPQLAATQRRNRARSAPVPPPPLPLNATLPGHSIRHRVAQRRMMQLLRGNTLAMQRLNALVLQPPQHRA